MKFLSLIVLALTIFSTISAAIPLDSFPTFTSSFPLQSRRAPACELVARGSGTNEMYFIEVDPTTGALPISGSVTIGSLGYDQNYGTVGATTLRTAAQIGNATGAAAFGSGTVSTQTLRVVLPTDQPAVTVQSTNLDVRDLAATQDNVAISDGTDSLAVNADGSINSVVTATNLDTRDLDASQDNVKISDNTDDLEINADGSINAVATATNLDIRDLSAAQDNVRISDGTDNLAVNADGSLNTVATATNLDIRDISAAQDNIKISDGTDSIEVNADGSINSVVTATNLDVRDLTSASDSVRIGDGTDLANVTASNQLEVSVTASLPAGNNNIGDVDVTNLPATVDTNSGAAGASTLRSVLATRHEAAATPLSVRISNGSGFTNALQSFLYDSNGDPYASTTTDTGTDLFVNVRNLPTNVSTNRGTAGTSTIRVAPANYAYVTSVRNAYASTNVTTGAWVELIASTSAAISRLHIFDSCGQTLELGTGAAASETRVLIIPPGGFDAPVDLAIAASTRVSIRAISANCTTGEIDITGLN